MFSIINAQKNVQGGPRLAHGRSLLVVLPVLQQTARVELDLAKYVYVSLDHAKFAKFVSDLAKFAKFVSDLAKFVLDIAKFVNNRV
jgi:hypothetical protein